MAKSGSAAGFHCLVCLQAKSSEDEVSSMSGQEDNYSDGWRSRQLFENFLGFCNQYLEIDGTQAFQMGEQSCVDDKYGNLCSNWENSLCGGCERLLAHITDTHRQLLELEVMLLGKVAELEETLVYSRMSSSRATLNLLKKVNAQVGVTTDVTKIAAFRDDLRTKCRSKSKDMKVSKTEVLGRKRTYRIKDVPGGAVFEGRTKPMKFAPHVELPEQKVNIRVNEGTCGADYEDIMDFIKIEVPPSPVEAEMDNDSHFDQLDEDRNSNHSSDAFSDDERDRDYAPDGVPEDEPRAKKVCTRRSRTNRGDSESENDEQLNTSASKKIVTQKQEEGRTYTLVWNKKFSNRRERRCIPCNQVFRTYCQIVKHERKKHFFETKVFEKIPCRKCGTLTAFGNVEALYDHLATEHDEDKVLLKCEVCKGQHANFKELYAHLDSTHEKSGEAYMFCVYCDQAFATQQMRDLHKFLKHNDYPNGYFCEEDSCANQEFATLPNLTHHLATCHSETLFECEKCGMGFLSAYHCQLHELNHVKMDPDDLTFKCTKCNSGFLHKSQLLCHYNKAHGGNLTIKLMNCTKCSIFFSFSNKELESHVDSHNRDAGRVFRCSLCKIEFVDDKEAVYSHLKQAHDHNEAGKYKKEIPCGICNLQFPNYKMLSMHKKLKHAAQTEMCQYCGKGFKLKNKLMEHVRQVHTKEGLAICDHCGNGYGSIARLSKHIAAVHNKSFKCHLCNKLCSDRANLEMHIATHTDSGSADKQCTWCVARYVDTKSLQDHVKVTHPEHWEVFSQQMEEIQEASNTTCKLCEQQFTTDLDFSIHMSKEHGLGVDWLRCPICPSRKCTNKDKMNNHLRRHGKTILGRTFTKEAVHLLFHGTGFDFEDPRFRLNQGGGLQMNTLAPPSSEYSVPGTSGGFMKWPT